jgi:hypothetical protein
MRRPHPSALATAVGYAAGLPRCSPQNPRRSWPGWPVLCLKNLKACMGPQMSKLLGRVLEPAFLILGMVATAAWTLLLGYGLFALVEAL